MVFKVGYQQCLSNQKRILWVYLDEIHAYMV